jgi:hypothetical protein
MLQIGLKLHQVKCGGFLLQAGKSTKQDNSIHIFVYLQHFTPLFLHIDLNFFTLVKKKNTKPNRGQVLATAVEATGLNKEEVALKAGYSRSSYYKHIDNPGLDFHILIAYGRAIKYDFTEDFPDMPKYVLEEPEEAYTKTPTLEEAIRQRELWKDKYLDLLEKYNRMIEEKISPAGN